MRAGACPIVRIAVLPVPVPKKTRPGARRLIVAMPEAATGASRSPGMASPEPSRIVWVCSAATAIVAQIFERIRWVSENHA